MFNLFSKFVSDLILLLTNYPPSINKHSKISFKSFLSLFQCKRQSQKCWKRGIFFILRFDRQANRGGRAIAPSPPGYATIFFAFSILAGSIKNGLRHHYQKKKKNQFD